jgi:PAS domain S-box-containing protein
MRVRQFRLFVEANRMSTSTFSVIDAAPEAMLVVDAAGVLVMANRKAEVLFCADRALITGKPVAPLIAIEHDAHQVDATGVLLPARRLNGETFQAEISQSTLRIEGEPHVIAIVRDVSAQSELEAERVRVKSTAERILLTAEGEKTVAERVRLEAEAELVKAEAEKTIAESVRIEAEAQRLKAEGEKTVAERVRLEAEAKLVKAESEKSVAERVRLEAEAERVKADHEKTIAERVRLEAEVVRIKAEVEKTEAERVRLEAEMELERLKGILHQSQRMESLGQLAGGVAHDFNNLLAVILNYAAFVGEELQRAVAIPEGSQWSGSLNDVKQIQVAAERASVLTHQLLAFARREVIQARPLSFNEAIRNIEEMLRRTIGEQIELTIDLEDNLSKVMADPGHIEQIILNLAINARDAMPMGGTLSIVTSSRVVGESEWSMFGSPSGSYICVQFSDNGSGMSADVCDRAFEPFFTTKPRGEGSGLGLATVYGIVLQSGGITKIYSDQGVGTCVTILLPVDPNGGESEPNAIVERSAAPNGCETILVVDDEEGLREVTRRILSRSGYSVLTASSGLDAIAIAALHPGRIDLLLTDVIMAAMQGPTVAKEVVVLRPDIRVLFMSGHAQPVLEAEAVLGTEFQLVEKPFDQKMLLDNVRQALDAVRVVAT